MTATSVIEAVKLEQVVGNDLVQFELNVNRWFTRARHQW